MFKGKKQQMGIGLVLGIIAGVIILVTIIGLIIVKLLLGENTVIKDVDRYEEALTLYTDNLEYHTGLMTFPETIPDSATDIDFYCLDHTMLFGSSGEFFLQCNYDAADYQAEVTRLQNIYKQYGSVKRPILYNDDNFNYPAYVAIDGSWGHYEYALLSGEHQITYVYTWGIYGKSKYIQAEYLPLESVNGYKQSQEEFGENYSIYLIKKNIDLENAVSYTYDNTRDYFVKVEKNHYEKVDYNGFYVKTYLDETDTEIIQNCFYLYYKDEYDSHVGLPEEILFEELQGYEFKSLELNEDKTIAIVTYFDDGEEKIKEYEIPKK